MAAASWCDRRTPPASARNDDDDDDDDDDAMAKPPPPPPPPKRARSAEGSERRERSSRAAVKQDARGGGRSQAPREVRAWGPLRRHTKVLVPVREFGVAGDKFYKAFVEKVYAPGVYTGKYYSQGFADLFFTADKQVVVYDVRVAFGWFDPDDEYTSGDDEGGDAATSGADDD